MPVFDIITLLNFIRDSTTPAVEVLTLNHWTAGEDPPDFFFF